MALTKKQSDLLKIAAIFGGGWIANYALSGGLSLLGNRGGGDSGAAYVGSGYGNYGGFSDGIAGLNPDAASGEIPTGFGEEFRRRNRVDDGRRDASFTDGRSTPLPPTQAIPATRATEEMPYGSDPRAFQSGTDIRFRHSSGEILTATLPEEGETFSGRTRNDAAQRLENARLSRVAEYGEPNYTYNGIPVTRKVAVAVNRSLARYEPSIEDQVRYESEYTEPLGNYSPTRPPARSVPKSSTPSLSGRGKLSVVQERILGDTSQNTYSINGQTATRQQVVDRNRNQTNRQRIEERRIQENEEYF